MSSIDAVLVRLDELRPNGKDRWRSRCPSCGGNKSALSVGVGDNGSVLLRCWKGCDIAQITAAMGVQMHELFPPSDTSGPPLKRRRLLTAGQAFDAAVDDISFVAVAASNLAYGTALSDEDRSALLRAAGRLNALLDEVRA